MDKLVAVEIRRADGSVETGYARRTVSSVSVRDRGFIDDRGEPLVLQRGDSFTVVATVGG